MALFSNKGRNGKTWYIYTFYLEIYLLEDMLTKFFLFFWNSTKFRNEIDIECAF